MKKKSTLVRTGFCLVIMILMTVPVFTQTASINGNTTYQTMKGFGGAITWYNNWVTEHPYKDLIYNLIFEELGLDILRIKNNYRGNSDFDPSTEEIVQRANSTLGNNLTLFLSSWTPPADLKVNGVLNGGTIIKQNGSFVYDRFADYWYDSLVAYAAKGVIPDYISIQNEPDYENTGWETCIFRSSESDSYPGYGIALDAVYNRIRGMSNQPGILAPEVTGIGNNLVQNYAANINLSQIDGIAYHLYNGGDGNNPDSFNSNFQAVKNAFSDKPIWQTEYDYGTPYNTAQLIHNAVVEGNACAYIFWGLIWGVPADRAIIAVANPWDSSTWSNDIGFVIRDYYYYVKHYSKYIDKGYQRIAASIDTSGIRISAFKSPANEKLTVVLLNDGSEKTVSLDIKDFSVGDSAVYTSSGNNMFSLAGSLGSGNSVTLPNQSATTVVIYDPSFGTPEPTSVPIQTPGPTPSPTPYSPPEAYSQIKAADFSDMNGVQVEGCSEGGLNIGFIENNDWIGFRSLDFYKGISSIEVRVASATSGGTLEVRVGNSNGTLLGSISVPGTGGWQDWVTVSGDLSSVTGVKDLYLAFKGGSGFLYNVNWFKIYGSGETPDPNKTGDVNDDGTVDILDALLIAQHYVDLPVSLDLSRADVDCNGTVDIVDALIIAQYYVGLISEFPC